MRVRVYHRYVCLYQDIHYLADSCFVLFSCRGLPPPLRPPAQLLRDADAHQAPRPVRDVAGRFQARHGKYLYR